jgi:Leu/Phe-tRNA-protein transferase
LYSVDVPDGLIVQSITWTQPTPHTVVTLDDLKTEHVSNTLQLMVTFHKQNFVHHVDFIANTVNKLCFHENIIQVIAPAHPALYKVHTQMPLTSEFYVKVKGDDMPN